MIERVRRAPGRARRRPRPCSPSGYRPDAFQAAYPDGTCAGVSLHYAIEPEPRDTAGAIRFAALDAGIAERFLVLNGDVLTDLDVGALVAAHERTGAEGTIALHRVDDPSAFGVVPTDDDGRVTAFIEKPPPDEAPTDLINAGTYVLEPSVLDRIAPDVPVNVERVTFPAMVADGSLFAVDGDTYWIDAGTPATYLAANLDLINGRRGASRPACTPTPRSTAPSPASVVGAGRAGRRRRHRVAARCVLARRRDRRRAPSCRMPSSGPEPRSATGAVVDGGTVSATTWSCRAWRTSCTAVRIPEEQLMQALVTGGAGFIGSTLVDRLLAEGHSVDVVDDLSSGSLANLAEARADRGNDLKVHQVDIRDPAVVELIGRRQPEVVFHLAAQADVRVSVARPAFDAEVNVLGSLNVLEGARVGGTRKVVFASSGGTIYGEPAAERAAGEGVAPAAAAVALRRGQAGRHRLPPRVPRAPLASSSRRWRMANIYGPRQDPHGEAGVVAIFAGLLLAGKPCTSSATASRPATSSTSTTPSTPSSGPPTGAAGCCATSAPAWRPR